MCILYYATYEWLPKRQLKWLWSANTPCWTILNQEITFHFQVFRAIRNAEVQIIIRGFRSEFAERKSSLSYHKLMKGPERFTKDKQTYGMLSASFQMQVYLPKTSCRYEFRQPTCDCQRVPKSFLVTLPSNLGCQHLWTSVNITWL